MSIYAALHQNAQQRRAEWSEHMNAAATVAEELIEGLRKALGPMPKDAIMVVPTTARDVESPWIPSEGEPRGKAWVEYGSGSYWFKVRITLKGDGEDFDPEVDAPDAQHSIDFVLGLLPPDAGGNWHLLSPTRRAFTKFDRPWVDRPIGELVKYVKESFEELFSYRYNVTCTGS